jgi:hypothetical protein
MINKVLYYDDILVHVFSFVSSIFKPCLMLVCKRWRDVFEKHKGRDNYKEIMSFNKICDIIKFNKMSLKCGEFLLYLNSQRETTPKCCKLFHYVVDFKIQELYKVLFIGESTFFICPSDCNNRNINKKFDEINYHLFCDRFNINTDPRGDREWLPQQQKRIKRF